MVGWAGTLSSLQLMILIGGLILLGLLGAQWWFLLAMFGQNGRLLARLTAVEERLAAAGLAPLPSGGGPQLSEGLPVGEPAPDFTVRDLAGEEVTLDNLRASGKPVMLIFTDPDCGPCTALLPQIGRWQQEHAEKLKISLLSLLSAEENRDWVAKHGVHNILLQDDWEVAEAYRVQGTPSAVVVSPEGTIDSPLGEGADGIGALVAQAGEASSQPQTSTGPPKLGQSAPTFEFPELEGRT